MTSTEPNQRLAEVLAQANLSSKAFARRIRDASARGGKQVAADHTSVSRWLRGMQPRPATVRLITSVLSERLGRTITPTDIGLRGDTAEGTSADYADDPTYSVATVTELWCADLRHDDTALNAPVTPAAWSEASLSWLVNVNADRTARAGTSTHVGPSDISRLRRTTAAFAELDNTFGGGHARLALIQYLSTDLAALIEGSYSEGIGQQLFAAAAEATMLAAWMSYDAGLHGLAQRYFIQALRSAQAGDDALLAANILDAMSHQATFLGQPREAANMARAARMGTRGRSTPGLTAHFYAMEARALASTGDTAGTTRALNEAVRVFERRRAGDDPEWIDYFDDAELSAEFGHCFRDLVSR